MKGGKRQGARALVFVGTIVGLLTLGLATQAWAGCICFSPPPHVVGGTSKQANPNNTLSGTVTGNVAMGETVVVSVATGTFAGKVECSDSKGNNYAVVADKNTGSGRLFVCSAVANAAMTPADMVTATATYPAFSGLSVMSIVGIPSVGSPGPYNTNSGSNPTVTSGTVTVTGDYLLFGVVANGNVATFGPTNNWTALAAQPGGSGAGKRTLTPVYKFVSGATTDQVTGNLSGSGFWQAAIVAYPVVGVGCLLTML